MNILPRLHFIQCLFGQHDETSHKIMIKDLSVKRPAIYTRATRRGLLDLELGML